MKRPLLSIFLIALVVRLAWVLTLGQSLTWSDEREYVAIARHLAAGEGFVSTSYRANPLLSFYLTGIFRLFGEHYLYARIGQAVFGAATCVLLAATAARLVSPAVGIVSGLLLALYLPQVYLAGVFYVECLFTMLVALTVYLASRCLDGRNPLGWGLLTGTALGLATLTRPIFIVFLPMLGAALVYGGWPRWRTALAAWGVALLATAAVIVPWTIRNHGVYGRLIVVSTGFGTKLWQGNNELAVGDADDREIFWDNEIWARRAERLDADSRRALDSRYAEIAGRVDALEAKSGDRYVATDSVLLPIALRYMWEHPARTAHLSAVKLATLFSPFSKTLTTNPHVSSRNRLVAAFTFWPMIVLAAAGAWVGFRLRRRLAVLYLLVASIAGTYGLLNTCTRFRLPLDPFLLVFAGLALVEGRHAMAARAPVPRLGLAGLWPALRTAVLLAVFFGAGVLGYRAYLASPDVVAGELLPARHDALARRAVFFIIDAFRPGRTFDGEVMPTLTSLAARGASGVARTGAVTTTAPCVYSLTTGRPGNLVQAIFNFHSRETRVDSLLSTMVASGGRIALGGDPAWHKQFGWLVPEEDRHESPEPGITIGPEIDDFDARTVDFLIEKMADPAYRLLIVHLGSVDAVGHMVTPTVPRYFRQLTFMDGQLKRVVDALDDETVLLVSGDHGMASRGTHGGEEEARATPYVLVGPGVRGGIVADLPQTALTSTLSALLGLSFLPVSEQPPRVELLDVPLAGATALSAEYFAGKLRAVRQVEPSVVTPAGAVDEATNGRLNEALFGAEDPRVGLRLLTGLVAALGLLVAAIFVWWSMPWLRARPPLASHLALAAVVPLGIVTVTTAFVRSRELFAFQSTSLAMALVAGLFVAIGAVGLALYRSPRLRDAVTRRPVSLVLPALIVLTAPLVTSHWLHPRPYLELLMLGMAIAFSARHVGKRGTARMVAPLPIVTAAAIYGPHISAPWESWTALCALSFVLLGFVVWMITKASETARARIGCVALGVMFLAAWAWRVAPGTGTASVVLVLCVALAVLAVFERAHTSAASALLVGASTGLFVIMASDGHEAFVFLAAALTALALSRISFDLSRPAVLYLVAATAVVVRIGLYFELGDHYNLSSIRTAPGFLLADYGLPLGMVVGLLLVKYSLPWVLIVAAVLPSLVSAGRPVALHLVDVLALGYVARFAAVAAIIDPFRALPNGMDGIIGMYYITWGEFVTFAIPLALINVLVPRAQAAEEAAPAVMANAV